MNQGLWVWPSEPKEQRRLLKEISHSEHLVAAMKAIAKSKDGLSNAQVDDFIGDSSNWMTLWVTRQLMSLGFAEYKVDLFGGPGKYQLTDLGKRVIQFITGQPLPSTPPIPSPATTRPIPAPVPSPAPSAAQGQQKPTGA